MCGGGHVEELKSRELEHESHPPSSHCHRHRHRLLLPAKQLSPKIHYCMRLPVIAICPTIGTHNLPPAINHYFTIARPNIPLSSLKFLPDQVQSHMFALRYSRLCLLQLFMDCLVVYREILELFGLNKEFWVILTLFRPPHNSTSISIGFL